MSKLNLDLYPKQLQVLQSVAQEQFYGGAAGGGKSHIARAAAITWASDIPGIQIYFFRRYYDDLVMNHIEGPTGFRALLEPWIKQGWCTVVEGEIRFVWGSKIFLRHCQYERDLPRLLGPEIHVLIIEEAGQFTESMIRFIRGRMRIPDTLKVPPKYLLPPKLWRNKDKPESSFPRALYCSNPGNVGHSYLKKAFITGHNPGELWRAPDDDGGMIRQFIPAKVDDNPSIDRDKYTANLKGLGSPQLVKALLEGDWDAVVGAFFPELDKRIHLIEPFDIPEHWQRFMSLDWGACGEGDPFSVGWWAVSDGSIPLYPRGTLICYKSWYGRGLPKTTVEAVCRGIKEREIGEPKIYTRIAGGDIKEQRGTGPSIYEIFNSHGIIFSKADQRRVSGWQQCRERFVGNSGLPALYFFKTCEREFETLLSLQHHKHDPNDCEEGDDHFADMVRYACMSRPWAKSKITKEDAWKKYSSPTIDELWQERDQLLQARR